MEHELKCWPEYFSAILRGDKPFEVRRNDRCFKVGDTLSLREWHPGADKSRVGEAIGYTGASLRVRVTYVLEGPGFGVASDHVIMGLESSAAAELRRLQGMRCETCKHRSELVDATDQCGKCDPYADFGVDCAVLGGGCLAWETRDE